MRVWREAAAFQAAILFGFLTFHAPGAKAQTADEVAAVIKEFHGYFAIALVKSDGVPVYSHPGLGIDVDEISFRGSFLSHCKSVLSKDLIAAAWEHRFPESAIEYGQALLAAARAATESGP